MFSGIPYKTMCQFLAFEAAILLGLLAGAALFAGAVAAIAWRVA